MFELGAFLLTLFNNLKDSQIVKMLFWKTFIISFSLLILPYIFIYTFLIFKRFFMPILWAIVEPLINQIIPAEYTLNITGLGAWFVNSLYAVECFTIVLSAVCMSFVIKTFIKR